jgi:hypothetical protein
MKINPYEAPEIPDLIIRLQAHANTNKFLKRRY